MPSVVPRTGDEGAAPSLWVIALERHESFTRYTLRLRQNRKICQEIRWLVFSLEHWELSSGLVVHLRSDVELSFKSIG